MSTQQALQDAPTWITIVLWLTRAVMALLVGLSVWSVSIMIERRRRFATAQGTHGEAQEARKLLSSPRPAGDLHSWASSRSSLRAKAVKALSEAPLSSPAYSEIADRSLRGVLVHQKEELERGLGILATLGSNAPFIGLFGTVLGVIQAFGELALNQRGTQGVMAAISEALVATAIGLFVAIPAVIAYNLFQGRLKSLLAECESLRDLWLARTLK